MNGLRAVVPVCRDHELGLFAALIAIILNIPVKWQSEQRRLHSSEIRTHLLGRLKTESQTGLVRFYCLAISLKFIALFFTFVSHNNRGQNSGKLLIDHVHSLAKFNHDRCNG